MARFVPVEKMHGGADVEGFEEVEPSEAKHIGSRSVLRNGDDFLAWTEGSSGCDVKIWV